MSNDIEPTKSLSRDNKVYFLEKGKGQITLPVLRGFFILVRPELNFFQLVYEVVRQVPRGKITTYSAIAKYLDRPKGARAVGWAMRACSDARVPCHRVIRADGSIAGFSGSVDGVEEQIKMLRRDGIQVERRRVVDLSLYFFDEFRLKL